MAFPGDGGAPILGQNGLACGSGHAMDESPRPEREPPELDSTPKAPKQMRMQVISFADMHEEMDQDLSTKAFGEEVIDPLESCLTPRLVGIVCERMLINHALGWNFRL